MNVFRYSIQRHFRCRTLDLCDLSRAICSVGVQVLGHAIGNADVRQPAEHVETIIMSWSHSSEWKYRNILD